MIRRDKLLILLVLVSVVEMCPHQCLNHVESGYRPGVIYTYDFFSELEMRMPAAEGQKSAAKVEARVSLSTRDGCAHILQLDDFKITGSNGRTYENIEGIDRPIVFQYVNGSVSADICADPNDRPHSLNVKRVVISLLHLARNGLHTDVFGTCAVRGTIQKSASGGTVFRSKRYLNACYGREHVDRNFVAAALKNKRVLEAIPGFGSLYTAEQHVDDGLLTLASARENYTLMDNGAVVFVLSTMRMTGKESRELSMMDGGVSSSIVFDGDAHAPLCTVDGVLQMITDFDGDRDALREGGGRKFVELVRVVRDCAEEVLLKVHGHVDGYLRRVLADAVLRSGTEEALDLVAPRLDHVKHPTSKSLQFAAKMIKSLPLEADGGVGILLRRYCETRSCPDADSAMLMKGVVDGLGASPGKDVVLLRTLRAAGFLTDAAAITVLDVVRNKKVGARVRAAALDALIAVACRNDIRVALADMFYDAHEDTELRIKVYSATARYGCPFALRDNESSLQVSGYVTKKLRDPRKYSFAKDMEHDLGFTLAKTSLDVIYSQHAYLPRAVRVNTTIGIFDTDVSVFESSLRVEHSDVDIDVRIFGEDVPRDWHFEPSIQNHLVFADTQLSHGTGTGFALRLAVEGVASFQLSNVGPSADVDLIGSIEWDGHLVTSGLKAITRLNVATGVKLDIRADEVRVSLPLREQRAVASHDIAFSVREPGHYAALSPLRFGEDETNTRCFTYLGLDACTVLRAPDFPANYRAGVTLTNTKFLHGSIRWSKQQLVAQLVAKDEVSGIDVEWSTDDGFAGKIAVYGFGHNATADARLVHVAEEVFVSGALRADDQTLGQFKLGTNIKRADNDVTYKPLAQLSIPTAHVDIASKGSASIGNCNVIFDNLGLRAFGTTYSIDGRLKRKNRDHSADLTMSNGHLTIKVSEKLRVDNHRLTYVVHVTNNLKPQADVHLMFFEKSDAYNLEITHGPDPKSTINRLALSAGRARGNHSARLTYPIAELDVRTSFLTGADLVAYEFAYNCGLRMYGLRWRFHVSGGHIAMYDAKNRFGVTLERDGECVNSTVYVNDVVYGLEGVLLPHRVAVVVSGPGIAPINVDYALNLDEVNFHLLLRVERILNFRVELRDGQGFAIIDDYDRVESKLEVVYGTAPAYHGSLTFYPRYRSIPSYGYVFETTTIVDHHSFDTWNSLKQNDKTLVELNVHVTDEWTCSLTIADYNHRLIVDGNHEGAVTVSAKTPYVTVSVDVGNAVQYRLQTTRLNTTLRLTRQGIQLSDSLLARNLFLGHVADGFVVDVFDTEADRIVFKDNAVFSTGLDLRVVFWTWGFEMKVGRSLYVNELELHDDGLRVTFFNESLFELQSCPLRLRVLGLAPLVANVDFTTFKYSNVTAGPLTIAMRPWAASCSIRDVVLADVDLVTIGHLRRLDYSYDSAAVDKLMLRPVRDALEQFGVAIGELLARVTNDPAFVEFPHDRCRHLIRYLRVLDVVYSLEKAWESTISWITNMENPVPHLYTASNQLNEAIARGLPAARNFWQNVVEIVDEASATANVIKIGVLQALTVLKDTALVDKLVLRSAASDEYVTDYQADMGALKERADTVEMATLVDVVREYTSQYFLGERVDDEAALNEATRAVDDVLNTGSWRNLAALVELCQIEARAVYDHVGRVHFEDLLDVVVTELQKLRFPQDFRGVAASGHVFTFDGRHVSVHGTCTLQLTGNDQFVITFKPQKAVSIMLNGDVFAVTRNDDDALTSTGSSDDLSYVINREGAWINSWQNDVAVECDAALFTCEVKVSGEHHGKLRGLMGNANHEPWDDYEDPTATVSEYTAHECRSAVGSPTSASCKEVLFRQCHKYVDPVQYEAACSDGLFWKIPKNRRAVQQAYASTCRQEGIYNPNDVRNYKKNFFYKIAT